MPRLNDTDALRGMTRRAGDGRETVRQVKKFEKEMEKTRGLSHGPYTVGELMESRDRLADPNAGAALLRRRRELPLNIHAAGEEGQKGLSQATLFGGAPDKRGRTAAQMAPPMGKDKEGSTYRAKGPRPRATRRDRDD